MGLKDDIYNSFINNMIDDNNESVELTDFQKKKTNVRTMIRQIVREEVAMAINEVITELKQPTQQVSQPKSKKKIVESTVPYKKYTENSVLNDMLNETAQSEEWERMGGGTYTSDRMNEVVSSQYGDLMGDSGEVNPDAMVASMGVDPNQVDDSVKNIFTKDYRSLMKKVDEKAKQKRGM